MFKGRGGQISGDRGCRSRAHEELTGWFEDAEIGSNVEAQGKAAVQGAVSGCRGITRSMDCNRKDFNYISIDGLDNCIRTIEDVVNGNIDHTFIEMSACRAAVSADRRWIKNRRTPIRDVIAVNRYAGTSAGF